MNTTKPLSKMGVLTPLLSVVIIGLLINAATSEQETGSGAKESTPAVTLEESFLINHKNSDVPYHEVDEGELNLSVILQEVQEAINASVTSKIPIPITGGSRFSRMGPRPTHRFACEPGIPLWFHINSSAQLRVPFTIKKIAVHGKQVEDHVRGWYLPKSKTTVLLDPETKAGISVDAYFAKIPTSEPSPQIQKLKIHFQKTENVQKS